ncbi:MAG TPA: sigma-70 family RNA polymerase sigma factor [Pirellulales bacterium]|jgi:RNA polymerase sigma-70 factor (ECF subfamily)|nr:sigma-70 family RNA polymerase sigma factor [Pirellulales bacterium]
MGDLGDRLARGDQAAFAELYDLCANRLHYYLVVRLGSREDADDTVQETFVRLARTRQRLSGVENLIAYVFTIARNEAARLMARKSRDARERTRVETSSQAFRAADDLESREASDTLVAALARLSLDQREIVELKTSAGLTLREIALVMGLPPGTVATRYRTAIGRLREWLSREHHE